MPCRSVSETAGLDAAKIGEAGAYAREAIRTAAKAGIVNGYKDGTFRPDGQATRAETTTMLVNLLMLIPGVRELLES